MGFKQDPEPHNITFKMAWIQSRITQHGKRQSTDANAEMTQMLELSDKDFKAAITELFQQPIISHRESNGKTEV